jgi:hypothetical protein
MNRSLIFRSALIALTSIGLVMTSCKKDNDDDNNNNNTTKNYRAVQDNNTADGVFSRAYNQVSGASYTATSSKAGDSIPGCPTLYITGGAAYPKTVTLDFGTGCACNDGITRYGKIVSVISAPYIDSGSVVTSTFDNYHEIINYVDYQATGTQVITNLGHNGQGHPMYSVNVTGASVISVYGTISYTSQRTNEWSVGYDSWLNPFDDEYLITGSATGTDINGDPFAVTIDTPLNFKIYCDATHYWTITSGTLTVSYPGTSYPNITVDYGTGDCDNTVNIIINGVTYTIVLT